MPYYTGKSKIRYEHIGLGAQSRQGFLKLSFQGSLKYYSQTKIQIFNIIYINKITQSVKVTSEEEKLRTNLVKCYSIIQIVKKRSSKILNPLVLA